jgi:hypothetical protein
MTSSAGLCSRNMQTPGYARLASPPRRRPSATPLILPQPTPAPSARTAAYAEAEQRHYDRLAATQRHFGQQIARRGDPIADHAVAFVEIVADLEGLYALQPAEAPIGRVVEISYNGIKRQVRVDANGRVVAENPVADDGWSTRGTFSGDTEALMAAKRAGVGLKADPEEPPPAPPVLPPPIIRAEPRPEPPPPGLLADIAATLARVESKLR